MGLQYYSGMKDAPSSELLMQTNFNTEIQLMAFSDSSWQDCTDTDRSTGTYIIFIKVGQLNTAHMFQDQLLNEGQKVSTIQHAQKE